jgi:5-methylthioadenosine/S-adenosylhomocysteine deaminase
VAPVPAMIEAGVAVGIGTDGAGANNDLNLWEEVDTAAKLQKVTSGDPTVMNARQALAMATIEGARALGLADEIGSLEVGKRADLNGRVVVRDRRVLTLDADEVLARAADYRRALTMHQH